MLDAQAAIGMFQGELKAARRIAEEQLHLERGLGLYDPAQQSAYTALAAEDPQGMMLFFLSNTLQQLGYLEQAQLQNKAAQDEARRLGHLLTLGWAYFGMILSQIDVGAFAMALKNSEELLAFVEKHDLSFFWIIAIIFRGRCLAALGQGQVGIEVLESSLATYRASRVKVFLPVWLAYTADAYLSVGQPEQGLKLIAEAVEQIEGTGQHFCEAPILCIRGKLLLAIEDTAAADESFRQAIAVARHQTARLWELRAGLNLARLRRNQGQHSEARDLLRPTYNWFTEGFDTLLLKEAKALLDELT